jgi:hypothetical protein
LFSPAEVVMLAVSIAGVALAAGWIHIQESFR